MSTNTQTQATKGEQLLATLKALPTRFGPARAKVGDPKPDGKGSAGYTSKDKAVLGIGEDDVVTWAPVPLEYGDSNMIKAVAEKMEIPAHKLMANIINKFIIDNYEGLDEIAGDVIREKDSEDDLQKKIAALQARQKALMDRLSKMGNK